jgi:predicted ATP-grasp superfamily ATP-dependent carboligase
MDALVTDAHERAVVAGLRGLGVSGVSVTALAPDWSGAGLWSRFTADRTVGPDPAVDAAGFADRVGQLTAERGPMVVYPGREEAIEALLDRWNQMPPSAVLPYPGVAPLRAIRDKARLPALAAAAGFRAPATISVTTAAALASSVTEFPCIVKPGAPVGRLKSAHLVRTEDELRTLLRRRRVPGGEPVLMQEWLQGPLVSLEVVIGRKGQLVGRFQQVTQRTWPAAAGSIAFGTSVEPDERLAGEASRMLADAGYWGLAQLDFVSTGDGPVLVDVNPRFYSCLPLAIACGVNLPAAWHAVALDEPARCPDAYPTGVSFRWLEGDLVAAARGFPRLLLKRAPPPRVGSMWASSDPIPGIMLAMGVVGSRLRRLARLVGRS